MRGNFLKWNRQEKTIKISEECKSFICQDKWLSDPVENSEILDQEFSTVMVCHVRGDKIFTSVILKIKMFFPWFCNSFFIPRKRIELLILDNVKCSIPPFFFWILWARIKTISIIIFQPWDSDSLTTSK